MLDDARVKITARQLADHYRDCGMTNICACTGLTGQCVGCAIWWEQFLKTYTAEDVSRMHRAYKIIKDGE